MNNPNYEQAYSRELESRLQSFRDEAIQRRRDEEQLLRRIMNLERAVADRDHLIRELAERMLKLAEVAPDGHDWKGTARLYNRAQDLVGWDDDE